MSPVTTRRQDADEEEYLENEEVEVEDEPQAATPALSDSRRRRQAKRGVLPQLDPSATSVTRKDAPTAPRVEPAKSRNPLVRFFQNVREYWRDTEAELRKVAWPTRDEVRRLTYIVIGVTFASAVFLGTISFLFSYLTTQLATTTGGTVVAALFTIALIIVVAGLWLFRDRLFPNRPE